MKASSDGSHLIVRDNFFETLKNCEGWYDCPVDRETGELLGPVVGYTADHPRGDGTKWVGMHYANFSKADPYPAVLAFFGLEMAVRLQARHIIPTLVVGAPWAGVKFSQEVARQLGCRHIFAEKKNDGLTLGRYEDEVKSDDQVCIGEELVNNLSTTGTLKELIEDAGGTVIGIMCAINRSSPFMRFFTHADGRQIPIAGVIEREMPQYHQDDPAVADAIRKYGLIAKPKYAWGQLKAAMDAHR
jgi:orotate phosphoribosyltransferase